MVNAELSYLESDFSTSCGRVAFACGGVEVSVLGDLPCYLGSGANLLQDNSLGDMAPFNVAYGTIARDGWLMSNNSKSNKSSKLLPLLNTEDVSANTL